MRAGPHSAEETEFLAWAVAGPTPESGVSSASLLQAPGVLLAGFEPGEESRIAFLRLRQAVRSGHTAVHAVAALASLGLTNLSGTLLPTPPGHEADLLSQLADPAPGAGLAAASPADDVFAAAAQALSKPGSVILAGERLAEGPGARTAAVALAELTGARLAWIPRRAGERGAIEAGALPVLFPGGRRGPGADARAEGSRAGGAPPPPAPPGRATG